MLNHLSMCTTYIHVVNVPLSLTYLPLSYNACDTKKTLYREEEEPFKMDMNHHKGILFLNLIHPTKVL